ncbi:MAG TPA: NAD(P)/FAD-dependent oxidoreductase [Desulfonatronum sp.]|nr:NAD(P)/FAD-dependent oxidoreductase [Desulfonatronum sp.]
MTQSCDILILGGGPAGYAAALEAASLNKSVVLVEKDFLGGTCLNRGCIPTKLFLGASQAIAEIQAQSRLRLGQGGFSLDMRALQKRKALLLSGSRQAMAKALEAAGVRVVQGQGELLGPNQVLVRPAGETTREDKEVRIPFDRLILALGSRPAWPKGLEPDGEHVLLSDHILDLQEAPASLVVIGAGAIGIELAQFFLRMGSQVSLLEAAPQIAPTEDAEISAQLAAILKRQGLDLQAGVAVRGLERKHNRGGVAVILDADQRLDADKVLVAVGRKPNTDVFGLDQAGVVRSERGAVSVDAHLRAAAHIYAVGDCNGRMLLAHAAEHQGRFAARHAAGAITGPYRSGAIPFCIYGDPEAIRVGPTAQEAAALGLECTVSRAVFAANPVAQAFGAPHGLVKATWNAGKIIGVSAVGHGALHFVSAAVIMVDQGWTRDQVEEMIFAHPTLDETLRQALLAPQEPL